mmetsp:Transcript_42529/g.121644  ORF Transcript_42529/g.121644 Transcript_42529/m.121644 type:complete len:263 (+) Transcript_42529:749-1537(+)
MLKITSARKITSAPRISVRTAEASSGPTSTSTSLFPKSARAQRRMPRFWRACWSLDKEEVGGPAAQSQENKNLYCRGWLCIWWATLRRWFWAEAPAARDGAASSRTPIARMTSWPTRLFLVAGHAASWTTRAKTAPSSAASSARSRATSTASAGGGRSGARTAGRRGTSVTGVPGSSTERALWMPPGRRPVAAACAVGRWATSSAVGRSATSSLRRCGPHRHAGGHRRHRRRRPTSRRRRQRRRRVRRWACPGGGPLRTCWR